MFLSTVVFLVQNNISRSKYYNTTIDVYLLLCLCVFHILFVPGEGDELIIMRYALFFQWINTTCVLCQRPQINCSIKGCIQKAHDNLAILINSKSTITVGACHFHCQCFLWYSIYQRRSNSSYHNFFYMKYCIVDKINTVYVIYMA